MAREKHDKKAGGLIESMDINYSVIWAIKQKPSMTFCPLYVLLRGMKKNNIHKSANHNGGNSFLKLHYYSWNPKLLQDFSSIFKQTRTSGGSMHFVGQTTDQISRLL